MSITVRNCSSCGNPIESGQGSTLQGKPFHKKCLTCQVCGLNVSGKVSVREGRPVCEKCANIYYVKSTSSSDGNEKMEVSLEEEIEKLKKLKEEGKLTDNEYDARVKDAVIKDAKRSLFMKK